MYESIRSSKYTGVQSYCCYYYLYCGLVAAVASTKAVHSIAVRIAMFNFMYCKIEK